jgi:hypothetical protein
MIENHLEFDQPTIVRHINEFDRDLLRKQEERVLYLSSDFWQDQDKLDSF